MTTNITFTLPAEAVEGATEAILLGDFNNWNPEKAPRLERQEDGSFKAVAQLEAGHTYQYRFLLDNSRWVNDYNAQSYVDIPGYHVDNCVITVPEPIAEENKKAKRAKPGSTAKKTAKAEPATKQQLIGETELQKAKAPKKAPAKATSPTAVKTKSADEKAQSKKSEKSVKEVKKSAPKAKK